MSSHSVIKQSNQPHKRLWATILLQDRPEGLAVHCIKGLFQIYKDRLEGLVLFNALLLHLSDDKYHVHGAVLWSEATLRPWETSFGDRNQSAQENAGKDLSRYGKK